MDINASNDETPRTTYPFPQEIIEIALGEIEDENDSDSESDSEKHLTLAWQEEQYSARHEQPCDEEGYDCPEFDDD
jgi:hypothetical protein